jgi:hypothetical protein
MVECIVQQVTLDEIYTMRSDAFSVARINVCDSAFKAEEIRSQQGNLSTANF